MIQVRAGHFETFGGRRYQRGNGIRTWASTDGLAHESRNQGIGLDSICAEEHEEVGPGHWAKTASTAVDALLLVGIPVDVGGVHYSGFGEPPSGVDNRFSFQGATCLLPVGEYL
ncbi:hypothetical protein AWC16_22655 [Mycolicibacter longobardus]|uniref:Uncharacterized protein n=1 Tax=Mycolicibacter longobardus TaxID=1108812 RepID=A0A1X1Y7F1_9MYCO|nr:hypothetical protein AWC16_22655 [Mycolicibacter longobardus]